MSNEKNEFALIATERNYSNNFVDALTDLDKKNQIKLTQLNERQKRIVEITDFISRTFDPHMKQYIRGCSSNYMYFSCALSFMELYYPEDYISRDDFHDIMKNYGIRNYYKLYRGVGKYLPVIIIAVYFMISSFLAYQPNYEFDEYVLAIVLLVILSAIASMFTILSLGWLYRLYEKIMFWVFYR